MCVCNTVCYWEKAQKLRAFNTSLDPLGMEQYLIKIGSHVRLNSDVSLVTHDGGMCVLRELYPEMKEVDLFWKIKIGNNVHIGINAMIMPNVHVGNNCIVRH